jgi:adenylyl-sulfate kinase
VIRAARNARIAIWLEGLSGAGKSATAQAIAAELAQRARRARVLDGDQLRDGLNADLGFSRVDRLEAARRTATVSVQVAARGVVPVTAMITPYARSRSEARALHEAAGVTFFEVWVATPIEVCVARDVKGLYAAAERGELTRMTGVDDPFEEPEDPDCIIDASVTPAIDLARVVLSAAGSGVARLVAR